MLLLRLLFACVVALSLSNCRKKSEAVAKEIGEAGYAMTPEGWFSAVRGNDVPVMRKMVGGGFDGKILDTEGNGALHLAASSGSREAADYLLNRGFPIDAAGAGGRTPLMAAVISDKPEMVKWLLRQDANPQLRDEQGFMALMLAVTEGHSASAEELAPYHREDLDDALLAASLVGQAGVIDTLTSYGASVYARMEDGRTPLMLAAQNGHMGAAEMLIDIGASLFATMENGDTAQSMAIAAGHADLAKLIEKGFSGDALALESDEQVAAAMDGFQVALNETTANQGEDLAVNDVVDGGLPWNKPIPGQGQGEFGILPRETAAVGTPQNFAPAGEALAVNRKAVSNISTIEGARIGKIERRAAQGVPKDETLDDLPLIMRHYRQRELPVEVKRVSGGVALLRIAGVPVREVAVKAGEAIPGSDLSVIRVFSRTEQGKLNDGAPIQVGIIEVVDSRSGRKIEWAEGHPAAGHEPVALVEDAATGQRYVAKLGEKFKSEDGREFVVSDVRPSQIVIEESASGEARTLRLRGPKG